MASKSIQAAGHRRRQALRPRSYPLETENGIPMRNVADWVHDTAVTNRAEIRAARKTGERHRCVEAIEKDEKGNKRSKWTHATSCPKWKAPEKAKEPVEEWKFNPAKGIVP
jgi:hypothetical protein